MEKFTNPFERIYEQLDRLESMMLDLRQELNRREKEPHNHCGIEMAERITGYSRNTLYKLVHQREIPHSKHRGKLRFDEQLLREWSKGKARHLSKGTGRRGKSKLV